MNINDPRFLAWWEKVDHLKSAYGFNKLWDGFFETKHTASEILDFARGLGSKYGLDLGF